MANTVSKRIPVLAGNWKMHGVKADAQALAASLSPVLSSLTSIEKVICPPFLHLELVSKAVTADIKVGAQDCSGAAQGAYTGETSAAMLKDAGIGYVILGHSERRQYHGENGPCLKAKIEQAREAGLTIIFCVGETKTIREAGQSEAVVIEQLQDVLPVLSVSDMIIAYEPVWAIGTGLTASPEDAQSMHRTIRAFLQENLADGDRMRILYGGSVKPDNAVSLSQQPDIDGFLVGGASLKAADFGAIGTALAAAKS